MKKIIFFTAITVIAIFTIVSCKKNIKTPDAKMSTTAVPDKTSTDMNKICQGYVDALKTKTRTLITIDSAVTQMEGAANYTYARLYQFWSNRFYYKHTYPLDVYTGGYVSSGDISTLYAQIISDLGTFRDDVESHGNDNIWLAMVDFRRVGSGGEEIEVFAIFVDTDIDFDPEQLTNEEIHLIYKAEYPQSFDNTYDVMCTGNSPCAIPFQTSASSVGVLHYADLKWNLDYNTGGYNVYSPWVNSAAIESCIIDQTYLYHGTSQCMSHTDVNYYVGLQPNARAVGKSFAGLPSPLVYIGQSDPCTYADTDCNNDFAQTHHIWTGGNWYFGNLYTAGQAVQNL